MDSMMKYPTESAMPTPREVVSTVTKTLRAMKGRRPYRVLRKIRTTSDHVPESAMPPLSSVEISAIAKLEATAASAMTTSASELILMSSRNLANRNFHRPMPPARTVRRVP